MSLGSFMRRDKGTAGVAKERLQIILALERADDTGAGPDYLPALQRELVDVVGRYVKIDPSDIKVHFERQGAYEVLEVKVELADASA
ncbi:cell division topological specificity factor MinE [Hydrogenophaga sp.]|uniref:cell division topological specificity factor MinE n=1 Tax=Hydrogenophaga sp. TaxID=1904254 RepID=UPI003F6D047B